MKKKKPFPSYIQLDTMDCGPTCLRMIAKYYGKHYSLETLRRQSFITREGVSMLGISDAAEHIGFRTSGVMISFEQLVRRMRLYNSLITRRFCGFNFWSGNFVKNG